jgi:putative transposase
VENPDGDDAAWAEARRKADVVSVTLADAPANVRISLAEAARILGVNRSTVGRWRIKFEADRRVTALLPRRRGRPAWTSQIDPKVDEVIDRQLRGYYRRPERPSIRSVIDRIRTSCNELGLAKPSWRAVKRRIRRLDPRTRWRTARAQLPLARFSSRWPMSTGRQARSMSCRSITPLSI